MYALASAAVPKRAADIERVRAAISLPKDLTPHRTGHIYTGSSDKVHLAYEDTQTESAPAAPSSSPA